MKKELHPDDARMLADYHAAVAKSISVKRIVDEVSQSFGVDQRAILSPCRYRKLMPARFACYWLARNVGRKSTTFVGSCLNNRDHTTIMHGSRRAAEMMKVDAAFKGRVTAIRDRLLARAIPDGMA